MTRIPDFASKTDEEIDEWIRNHEAKGVTQTPLYCALLEERARRSGKALNPEVSLAHLISAAKARAFTTYGNLADASGVPWSQARHLMNGEGGHLDRLLDVCHARGLPLLTAICVNQQGVRSGRLAPEALAGFIKGVRRLGYQVSDSEAQSFLRKCQQECFTWGAGPTSAASG